MDSHTCDAPSKSNIPRISGYCFFVENRNLRFFEAPGKEHILCASKLKYYSVIIIGKQINRTKEYGFLL